MCESDSRPARVWTGHADGTIMLHAEGKWGVASYRTQVCSMDGSMGMASGGSGCQTAQDSHQQSALCPGFALLAQYLATVTP